MKIKDVLRRRNWCATVSSTAASLELLESKGLKVCATQNANIATAASQERLFYKFLGMIICSVETSFKNLNMILC